MVTPLMMSAKMAAPGPLKLNAFLEKSYDVIIPVHDVTKNTLSRDSNYNVNLVM